jgi:hypothetical protein
MIHHMSLAARDPQRVASAIARLWRGEARPFPPVAKGSWVAMAGDDRGTTMEVYPLGTEFRPAEGDADGKVCANPNPPRYGPGHAAVASSLGMDEVMALAAQEGWTARYRKRGGLFGVIEFWLEDSFMLEVLTPEMQAEYLAFMTSAKPQSVFAKA